MSNKSHQVPKLKIELEPYNALAIVSFLREFVNEENANDYRFKAIHDAVAAYESQVYDRLTNEQLDDALRENEVNKLINKWPTP